MFFFTSAICRTPLALGMQTGRIPDNAITASSYYDTRYYPWHARLNTRIHSCSWTSTSVGRVNSWLQVDLGELAIVTGMAIQGSCTIDEWAESYSISYSTSARKWLYYKESGNKKVC